MSETKQTLPMPICARLHECGIETTLLLNEYARLLATFRRTLQGPTPEEGEPLDVPTGEGLESIVTSFESFSRVLKDLNGMFRGLLGDLDPGALTAEQEKMAGNAISQANLNDLACHPQRGALLGGSQIKTP